MLVLSRRRNESIVIGDSITIKVLGFRGATVSLGIEAAREIPVHREEVYAAIQTEAASSKRKDSSVGLDAESLLALCTKGTSNGQ